MKNEGKNRYDRKNQRMATGRRRKKRHNQKKRLNQLRKTAPFLAACVTLVIVVGILQTASSKIRNMSSVNSKSGGQTSESAEALTIDGTAVGETDQDQQDELEQQEALIEEGNRLSAGYDYDAAIELIQS
ncbi:MAG: hypothetical protein LIO96_00155, partial [Lachnospiraceae bacterium]|nr:hypothetical protein [Lachnospiraceae bacterium]